MAIRFPPERRQPPPHYSAGPRRVAVETTRAVVRAISHPDAVRITPPRELPPLSDASPVPPHAIVFAARRPPPGTVAAPVPPPRTAVRAVVYPAAHHPPRSAPLVELRATEPIAPHRIAFAAPIAPPPRR